MDAEAWTPLVVMGVSGVGKTTIARLIAMRSGMPFVDADDLHSPASIAKMSAGIPLTDEDRAPWLDRVGAALAATPPPVLACSALKRAYRDALRAKAPNVRFIHLDAPATKIAEMAAGRHGHFMPESLLPSQLDALEPLQPDEPGIVVTVDAPAEELAEQVLDTIRSTGR